MVLTLTTVFAIYGHDFCNWSIRNKRWIIKSILQILSTRSCCRGVLTPFWRNSSNLHTNLLLKPKQNPFRVFLHFYQICRKICPQSESTLPPHFYLGSSVQTSIQHFNSTQGIITGYIHQCIVHCLIPLNILNITSCYIIIH